MEREVSIRSWRKDDNPAVKRVLSDGSWSNAGASFKIALGRPTSLAVSAASVATCFYLTRSIQACIACVCLHVALVYLMVVLGIVYYLYGPPLADMTDVAASYFEDPDHHFWVAEVDGAVAGTIAIVRKQGSTNGRKIAWLRRMVVDRRYRRLGIAKKLITATIDFSRSHGYESIELITTEIHAAARTLYKSLGFVQVAYKPYRYLLGLIKVWTYEFEYRL